MYYVELEKHVSWAYIVLALDVQAIDESINTLYIILKCVKCEMKHVKRILGHHKQALFYHTLASCYISRMRIVLS